MVNKNDLSCLLKDGREVDAVTLVGRLFHACATVTRNDRSSMVLSRVRGTIRRGQEPDRSRCRDSASSVQWRSSARYEGTLWLRQQKASTASRNWILSGTHKDILINTMLNSSVMYTPSAGQSSQIPSRIPTNACVERRKISSWDSCSRVYR